MLGTLLAPIGVETFFADYWERQPLHVSRSSVDAFAGIYALADVEDALIAGARDLERFALVKAGAAQAPVEAYAVTAPPVRRRSTGKPAVARVDPRKVADLVERGYTLVINDAALLNARLQRTCNRLQRDLGAYVGANVYLTPPGGQGLDVHHDTHDTLTIQIEGSKTWRIYRPHVELPLESQELHRDAPAAGLVLDREVTLAAGETLYLPRGYAHQALAGDRRALHVTFALAPLRAIDLLHETLDVAAEADVSLRRALPRDWQRDPDLSATLAAYYRAALAALDASAVARAADNALTDLFAASRNDASGIFDERRRLAGATLDSVLALNAATPFVVREREGGVDVLVPGKRLALSADCGPALAQLQAGPVRVAAFAPELAPRDRSLLLATLVCEGLATIDAEA